MGPWVSDSGAWFLLGREYKGRGRKNVVSYPYSCFSQDPGSQIALPSQAMLASLTLWIRFQCASASAHSACECKRLRMRCMRLRMQAFTHAMHAFANAHCVRKRMRA